MQYPTPPKHSSVRWLHNRQVLCAPSKSGSTLLRQFADTVPDDWPEYTPVLLIRDPVDRLCSAYNMLVYKDIVSCSTQAEIDAYWQRFMVVSNGTDTRIREWRRTWGSTEQFYNTDAVQLFEHFVDVLLPELIQWDSHVQSQCFFYTAVQPNCPLYTDPAQCELLPLQNLSAYLSQHNILEPRKRNRLDWYIPASRRSIKNCAAMSRVIDQYYGLDRELYHQAVDK